MVAPSIQAGIRAFAAVLVIVFLLAAGAAHAAQLATKEPKAAPEQEDVLSLQDLMDGTLDLLPEIAPKDVPAAKTKEAAEKQSGEKEKKADASKDVPVTRTPAPQEPAVPAKEAPYRVYPSPYVPEDMSVPVAADAPVIHPSPGITSAQDKTQLPSVQTFEHVSVEKGDMPKLSGPVTVPVSGLSKQYFPVLPLNALPDASPQLLPLASNADLADDHGAVQRAIIFIHDLSRNASDGLSMLTTLAGADNGAALILVPQFPLEIDIVRFEPYLPDKGRDVVRWPVARSSGWQTGEDSLARPPHKGISSFTAIDVLLLYLADRSAFPSLRKIVVAGHGAGADFVQRYAAVGQAPDILEKQKLPVHFLAANPSSYLYFTNVRPAASGPGFALPDTAKCGGVNAYPYGLGGLNAYARRNGGDAIRLRYPSRRVTYLLGGKIVTDAYLDTDCAAVAQGRDRLDRGRNYERYLKMSFGESAQDTHKFFAAPDAGYDPVALFGSYCSLIWLFGEGECKPKP